MSSRFEPAPTGTSSDTDNLRWRFVVLALAGLAYAFPLITTDRLYLDDLGRALHGDANWHYGGRPLADILFGALSFGNPLADISPLPQMLGILLLAAGAALLSVQLFPAVKGSARIPALIVVFPVIGSPFFLENLAYKFDALTMSAAMFAAIVAARSFRRPRVDYSVGTLLIVATLSLYQPAVNAFIAFTVLLWFASIEAEPDRSSLRILWANAFKFVAGSALYFLLVAPFTLESDYTTERSRTVEVSRAGFETMQNTFERTIALIAEYIASLPLAVVACAAGVCLLYPTHIAWRAWAGQPRRTALPIIAMLPFALAGLALSPFGILLLLENPIIFPRTFVGFAGIMVFALYAFHRCTALLPGLRWLLLAPLTIMWVHAHIFAGALKAQDRFDQHFVSGLVHQLQTLGMAASHALILDGQQPRAPLVLNAIRAWQPIDRLVPPYIHYQWVWGYLTLRHYGLEFQNTPDNWAQLLEASCDWPTLLAHPSYRIRSDGEVFVVSLGAPSCN